jgi:hypothetical protein
MKKWMESAREARAMQRHRLARPTPTGARITGKGRDVPSSFLSRYKKPEHSSKDRMIKNRSRMM